MPLNAAASSSVDNTASEHIGQAASLTIGELLRARAQIDPQAIAITQGERSFSYQQFNDRVNQLAHGLHDLGVRRGDRLAVLSENRFEYLETVYAAAKLGAIVCALNWRLADAELTHCIQLVSPVLLIASQRHAPVLDRCEHKVSKPPVVFEADYEPLLNRSASTEFESLAQPEDGLIILYTSGTTGLPKGALISHRAEIARLFVNQAEMELVSDSTFIGWPPMFHMGCMDQAISTLSVGGKVAVVDGFDLPRIVSLIETERIWWLVLLPGTIEDFCQEMKQRGAKARGVSIVGAMADLIPLEQLVEVTTLLNAPFANTFGSTETGIPPASASRIGIGESPDDLRKRVSVLCRYRLVDDQDNDVADGTVGELAIRGPTLFSGYWNAAQTNEKDFRGGWFHTGDAFFRNPDGTLSFSDRVKYMIKSGGENIYPAEIERVILSVNGVADAVVVRRKDARWGEVPVAFVARTDDTVSSELLAGRCREELAGYKQPKAIEFVALEDFPRSTTGKIQRHEVERWVASGEA